MNDLGADFTTEVNNNNEEILLDEINIILKIPKGAVKLTVNAIIINENGELGKVSRDLSLTDIQDARTAFLNNVDDGDDYDVVWSLTDKGKKMLDELEESILKN